MANRKEKEKMVEALREDLSKAKVVVLTDYRGLTVAQINSLRRILKEEGAQYKVVKNTLMRLAVKETGLEKLEPYLEGPTAIAYGYDEPVVPVKLLVKFAKENDHLSIKAGALEGISSRKVICGAYQSFLPKKCSWARRSVVSRRRLGVS